MEHYEFLSQVKQLANLASLEDADRAVFATLETLSERITGGEDGNLAAQLPTEIGNYLRKSMQAGEGFNLDEFFRRVSRREGAPVDLAAEHARAVLLVLQQAVAPGLIEKVKDQLPDEFDGLFLRGGVQSQ